VKKNLAGSAAVRGSGAGEDDSDDEPRALPGGAAASGSADGQPAR